MDDDVESIHYDDGRPSIPMKTDTSTARTDDQYMAILREAVNWFDRSVRDPVATGQPKWVFDALRMGIQPEPQERTVTVLVGPNKEVICEDKGYDAHPTWGIGTAVMNIDGSFTLLKVNRPYDENRTAE